MARIAGSREFGYTRSQSSDVRKSVFEYTTPGSQDNLEAFIQYAFIAGADPKNFFEAAATTTTFAAYPMALARASVLGFVIGGAVGYIFDPLHLHDSGFDEPGADHFFDSSPPVGWG